MVFCSPLWSGTLGSHPKAFLAREMSGFRLWGSSSIAGLYTISEVVLATSSLINSAKSVDKASGHLLKCTKIKARENGFPPNSSLPKNKMSLFARHKCPYRQFSSRWGSRCWRGGCSWSSWVGSDRPQDRSRTGRSESGNRCRRPG